MGGAVTWRHRQGRRTAVEQFIASSHDFVCSNYCCILNTLFQVAPFIMPCSIVHGFVVLTQCHEHNDLNCYKSEKVRIVPPKIKKTRVRHTLFASVVRNSLQHLKKK